MAQLLGLAGVRPCQRQLPDSPPGVGRVRKEGGQCKNRKESQHLRGRPRIWTQGSSTEATMVETSHPRVKKRALCGAQPSVLLFGSPFRPLLVLHLVVHPSRGTGSPAQACRHTHVHPSSCLVLPTHISHLLLPFLTGVKP